MTLFNLLLIKKNIYSYQFGKKNQNTFFVIFVELKVFASLDLIKTL